MASVIDFLVFSTDLKLQIALLKVIWFDLSLEDVANELASRMFQF
uniref:Uncharacterized protein n=1 Tax=Rhizophora mucronata TaxID=61149 RepID=A0A2P2JMS7_RHIMU